MKLFVVTLFLCVWVIHSQYQPNWTSLDSRPIPTWYDDGKFGIFIHWGVYSVPSYSCKGVAAEWYWWGLDGIKEPCIVEFHNKNYGPNFKYADFAAQFIGSTFFDAEAWAQLFYQAGAKYVVLTSKHHEGYTNWPSSVSWNWNSVDVGPHQDTVGLLTAAVKKRGLHMGLYHSLFEWFNPLYLEDFANKGATNLYVTEILQPELHEIVTKYQPDLIWADGDWTMNDTYWQSKEFLAWLYNDSPVKNTVVVNDRWGIGDICEHGGYWTCHDRFNPHHLVNHKWENAMTIDKNSWGFARNHDLSEYLTGEQLITSLISTVAYGGNLLLNVGPTHDGRIDLLFQERLLEIGSWLSINGEAIYSSTVFRVQNETSNDTLLYYTFRQPYVYAFIMNWPTSNVLYLANPIPVNSQATISLLGTSASVQWSYASSGVKITLPMLNEAQIPGNYAWTLKFTNWK